MARRQRTLYEFVDPDALAAGEIASETRAPSPSAERRRFAAGRVAAGLALLAGTVLFAAGVWQLRSPLSSVANGDAPSAMGTVQRSLLPGADVRHARPIRRRRRPRRELSTQQRPTVQRPSRHQSLAPRRTARIQTPPTSPPVALRATSRRLFRAPAASQSAREFGFER